LQGILFIYPAQIKDRISADHYDAAPRFHYLDAGLLLSPFL